MATYRSTPFRRLMDRLMTGLARTPFAPRQIWTLTVIGRTSGELRTVPITPMLDGDRRWLVAPYGPTGWVHNLRAAGTGTLRHGRRTEQISAQELDAADAAPILKRYLAEVPLVRPYVEVEPGASLAAFEAVAHKYPVFAVHPLDRPDR